MSQIPAGLRADHMRERMEDKATIKHSGALYVGSKTPVTFIDDETGTRPPIDAYETVELVPELVNMGLPLVSNGENEIPSYQPLGTIAIMDGAITSDKLGDGTVISDDPQQTRKRLSIHPKNGDSSILVIEYVAVN